MRRLRRRVLVGVLAGVAWLPVLAHPAGAHGELAEAEPPPNASLAASPGRIRIVLTERPNPLSRLSLIGPGGQRVELGQTRVTGRALEATVGPLPSGTYTLRWAAFSDEDGHLIDDSYRFQVGPGRLAEAPAGQPGLGALLAIVSRLVLLAGALLWTGSLMLGPLVERTGASSPSLVAFAHRLQGIGRWAVLATLLGEIVNLWAASGAGLEVWSGSFLLGSGTGRLVLGRLTVLAVGLGVSGWPGPRRRWIQLPFAVGYLGVLAFSGHARLAPAGPVSGPLIDAVHLLAGSAWLGGIVLLGLALRPARGDTAAVAETIRRFSPVALVAAGLLGVTGVFATEQQVLSASDLSETAYGQVLLAKLVLVGVLVLLSAHVGFILRPALARTPPGSSAAGKLASRLLRNLRFEAPVALGIIGCVALMSSRASPQAAATGNRPDRSPPPSPAPVLDTEEVGGRTVALSVVPGRQGPNRVVISVAGTPVDRVRLRIDGPDRPGAALWIPVEAGLSTAEVDFPFAGEWRARIGVSGEEEAEAEFPFTIGDPGRAGGALEALTVADLLGPARERCRDAIVGQQVAFAQAERAPVQIVIDRTDVTAGEVPGSPAILLGDCGLEGGQLERVAEDRRIPLVAPETAPPGPWSWRLRPEPEQEGRIMGRLAFEALHTRSAAIAVEGTDASARASRAFEEQFSALGGQIQGTWDLRASARDAVASGIGALGVDLLVLYGSPEAMAPLARDLDGRNWRPARSVLAGSFLFGPEILDAAPGWSRGGLVNVAGHHDFGVELVSSYVRELLETFPGERPSLRGFGGFLEGRLLLHALAGADPGTAGDQLSHALDGAFREARPVGEIALDWRPGQHGGAEELALFQLTPALNIFSLLGEQHSGHQIGGLLYEGGDLQRITSFFDAEGRSRPEGLPPEGGR